MQHTTTAVAASRTNSRCWAGRIVCCYGISSMDHNYYTLCARQQSAAHVVVLLIHCYGVECTHPIHSQHSFHHLAIMHFDVFWITSSEVTRSSIDQFAMQKLVLHRVCAPPCCTISAIRSFTARRLFDVGNIIGFVYCVPAWTKLTVLKCPRFCNVSHKSLNYNIIFL